MFYSVLKYGLILSQVQPENPGQAASTITEDGVAASEAVAQSIDQLWDDVLGGGLYSAIANLGIFFAVGTLLIFIVQWTKEMIDGDSSKGFTELIWTIVVIVLLANNGQQLVAVTKGLRGIINQTNQTLLVSTSASIQLQEAYQLTISDKDLGLDTPEIKRLRFLNRASKKLSNGDTLALFAVGTFGLHLITFFLLILLYGSYSQLNKKPPPSLVQLETGKAIQVAPLGNLERTPQVVSRFVSDTMTLMMNWSGTLPPDTVEENAKPLQDKGVDIGQREARGNKVPLGAWQASYALSSDFRKEFLQKLASITPPGVFKGTTQVVLIPLSIQSPTKIEEGKWKVKMIANLNIFDQTNNLGEVIPFNKEIFVRAVVAPSSPVNTSNLAEVIYQVRASGLEIYAMRDLSEENL